MTVNTLTLGDDVARRATADGVTNDAVGGDVNAFLENHIKIGNGSTIEQLGDATVELAEGEAVGKVTGEIVDGQLDENTVVEDVNQKSLDVTHMLGMMPRFVTRVEMNDLRKRMGDLRAVEGRNGVWARYDGGKLSGQGLDHKFNKIQIGADTMPSDNGIRYGFAVSYTQGDVDGAASTADTDTYSLAGYGVWLGEDGRFADVIARVAKVGTDLTTAAYSADLDQLALSLSGEFGWRFDLAKSLYVEPSIEATYTYIEDETFTGTTALFEIDSTHSFMTRAAPPSAGSCPTIGATSTFAAVSCTNSWATASSPSITGSARSNLTDRTRGSSMRSAATTRSAATRTSMSTSSVRPAATSMSTGEPTSAPGMYFDRRL